MQELYKFFWLITKNITICYLFVVFRKRISKINEYDLGLAYQLNKNAELSLRYALGTFSESSLEDMQTVVGAVRIDF